MKKDHLPLLGVVVHVLYLERHYGMLSAGIVCLAMSLTNAVMYYGNVLFGFLPIVQKTSVAMWVGWLLALQLAESKGGPNRSAARP